MKKIVIVSPDKKPQQIIIRQQDIGEWRKKTKIKDLLNFNKMQVEKLVC